MAIRVEQTKVVNGEVLRFDTHQRVQHILMFSSFIILAVTGLPLKNYEWVLSHRWIAVWGGIDTSSLVHRVAGVVMAIDFVYHLAYIFISLVFLKRPFPMKMVPNFSDVGDVIQDMKFTFGFSKERPKFDRFSYREKFDYWAVGWGILMMVGGGAILMFPVIATRFLPDWIVPVALVAHSDEAILAIGWILIVHMFFAHLAPSIFPFNKSIFTGRVPLKRYEEEHPLEYERLMGEKKAHGHNDKPVATKGQEAEA